MNALHRDICIMEAQLIDPGMMNGKNKSDYNNWRAKTLKAKAWKMYDYKMLKAWIEKEKARYREKVLQLNGIGDPKNPYCLLAGFCKLIDDLVEVFEVNLTEDQWRIVDQSREMIKETTS